MKLSITDCFPQSPVCGLTEICIVLLNILSFNSICCVQLSSFDQFTFFEGIIRR